MQAQERRLKNRARELWKADGSPPGKMDDYIERAKEFISHETNLEATLIPVDKAVRDAENRPYGEPIEPVDAAVRNQGEFPTLTDQGEEPLFPDVAEGRQKGKGR